MDENNLREAMRGTLVITPEPPPMSTAAAVTAGRRAVRRRMGLVGAGTTAAVLAVAALAMNPGLRLVSGGDDGDAPWAGPAPSVAPGPDDTEPAWPIDGNGLPQQDATARSGLRYEQGARLLSEILAVVPDGYTTPPGDADADIPLRDHQAAVESDKSWGYQASVAVAKDKGTGRLLAEVHTADNTLATEPCALARQFWGMGGDCTVTEVGSARVGVATGTDDRIDQWAAYRHPDGTVVFVAQSRWATNGDTARKPLTALPLTAPQLAALAVDQRFHLE